MLHFALTAAQIIVLIPLGILLWQIWRFLHSKEIDDDEPLGEERTKVLLRRLTAISICAIAEALLQIASAILRFVEGI